MMRNSKNEHNIYVPKPLIIQSKYPNIFNLSEFTYLDDVGVLRLKKH